MTSTKTTMCGRPLRWLDGEETFCVLPEDHVDPIEHEDDAGSRLHEETAAVFDKLASSEAS